MLPEPSEAGRGSIRMLQFTRQVRLQLVRRKACVTYARLLDFCESMSCPAVLLNRLEPRGSFTGEGWVTPVDGIVKSMGQKRPLVKSQSDGSFGGI
jgi:hypothetical protein